MALMQALVGHLQASDRLLPPGTSRAQTAAWVAAGNQTLQDWRTQRTAVQQELQQHEVQLQAAAEAALQLLEEQVKAALMMWQHTVAMLLTIYQSFCKHHSPLAASAAFWLPMHSMTCLFRVRSEPDHAVMPCR